MRIGDAFLMDFRLFNYLKVLRSVTALWWLMSKAFPSHSRSLVWKIRGFCSFIMCSPEWYSALNCRADYGLVLVPANLFCSLCSKQLVVLFSRDYLVYRNGIKMTEVNRFLHFNRLVHQYVTKK